MDKSFRIHANISNDTVLNVNMKQDFDFLEVLSLQLRQKDAYRLHSSNYGVVIGRVLANDAFGVPNAKVSVFIEKDDNDTTEIEAIYPYSETSSKDSEGRKYNLLPDYSDDTCYRVVGTFPNKRFMLDDDVMLEVYDKYWIYTTVTNQAGDYMLFGVPSGSQTIHTNIDLSDVGILSQKPRDMEYKGYDSSQFDSPNQFKESTNLDNLAQIISQDTSINVYPFWGDADNGVAAITRADVQVNYKFEPTCVFMGSIISDNDSNSIGHKCAPSDDSGMNNQLVTGNGTIEMIRKTVDGLVEEYQIQGNQLINENGVWCYQIPMNLDYIGTDEYGNVVPTDNPSKGIPTRTQVRFRISKNETGDEGFSRHTAKYLVPMNPIFSEDKDATIPTIDVKGSEIEKMYEFGSATPDSCFRDLYWNNVYSIKNYIPKTQVAHRPYSKNYNALKGSNLATDQNSIPFNKLRVDIPFVYMILCILFTIVMLIISFINATLVCLVDQVLAIFWGIKKVKFLGIRPFSWLPVPDYIGCISLSAGLTEGNTAFYPGCWCDQGLDAASCPEDFEGECNKSRDNSTLKDLVQRNLALEFKIIKLDLYQDWINGTLYMPLWYWRKRKKKTFLFLTLSKAKNEYCSCDKTYKRLKTYHACNIEYSDRSMTTNSNLMPESENRWHKNKKRSGRIFYRRGLIKPVENKDGLTVYYYSAIQALSDNKNPNLEMEKRAVNFQAIRLYATDIILLGNLNTENLYGIPQFFKCLPSTTVNLPPIATVEESLSDDDSTNDDTTNDTTSDTNESGTTVTTGMDWGHDGDEQTPLYRKGLFMDLACTYAATRPKSCINVERLSELGVNLDMSYDMSFSNGGSQVGTGKIENDGFITKLELDDMENRAMFATMNHIGFIPQSCMDDREARSLTSYQTQVNDENTNYLVNKFKYIYPVDFDGRLQSIMDLYKNGFEQAMFDERDQSYLTFRLGAEQNDVPSKNSENRIRHFYKTTTNSSHFSMPLYNNSFYFYFGINKGKTAIDKFNEMFWADCVQNDKKPFTLEVTKQGRSYCPSIYTNDNNAYGWIMVNVDDIRTPYSYRLYDSAMNLVVEDADLSETFFVIGGSAETVTSDVVVNKPSGIVKHQASSSISTDIPSPYGDSGLTNQIYTLEVTDSDGKTISERIKLEVSKIAAEYNTTKLGTKFYNTATTRIDYICNDDNNFYGVIELTGFTVDGYECDLKEASYIGYNGDADAYIFRLKGSSEDICGANQNNVIAILSATVYNRTEGAETKNCLCDESNDVANAQKPVYMSIADANIGHYFAGLNVSESYTNSSGDNLKILRLFVYQPNRFLMTIAQECNGIVLTENSTSEAIEVSNGENFNTYLNEMPTKFILGTTSDSTAATIANTSHFYQTKTVTDPTNEHIDGWYGVHQEDSYQFSLPQNMVKSANTSIWSDFVKVAPSINEASVKREILRSKFDWMFQLSDGVYITSDSSKNFRFSATGGVSPTLYRSVVPMYDDSTNSRTKYVLNDKNSVDTPEYYPNIVGNNYYYEKAQDPDKGPSFNKYYNDDTSRTYVGNYFAAFTKNGSYISKNVIDGKNINIMRQPNNASISPIDGKTLKTIGKDIEKSISDFKLAREAGTTHLPSDITRKSNPYLRAVTVDRRFDFDIVIMAPIVSDSFRLHSDLEKERAWKSGRISGFTYNGIEMAYDADYNIISASTIPSSAITYYVPLLGESEEDGTDKASAVSRAGKAHIVSSDDTILSAATYDFSKATKNKRLEYSYQYVSGETTALADSEIYDKSTITVYNSGRTSSVWGEWNSLNGFGYDEDTDKKDETIPLIKEFYEFTFGLFDLRHMLWSSFNKNRLKTYTTKGSMPSQIDRYGVSALENLTNPYYVFNYPSAMKLYTNDFNRDEVAKNKKYPTMRYIDIANLLPISQYDWMVTSCSYNMSPTLHDDGTIYCETTEGEGLDMSFTWSTPISMIGSSSENSEVYNIAFKKGATNTSESGETFYKFSANTATLNFTYNAVDSDSFTVYTSSPRVIQVLPYITNNKGQKTDGITYIKTSNPSSTEGLYGDGKTLLEAISDLTLHTFSQSSVSFWDLIRGNKTVDIVLPSDVSIDKEKFITKNNVHVKNGAVWFKKDDEYLPSNDENFTKIQFYKKGIDLNKKGILAFAVLVEREYEYNDDDHLTRRVHTVEASEIFDARPLWLAVHQSGATDWEYSTGDTLLTYVEVISGDASTNIDDGSQTEDEPKPTATTTVKTYIQTITFDMLFKNVMDSDATLDPLTCENQAFADYTNMSYTCVFNNGSTNYFISCNNVTTTQGAKHLIVHLQFTWSSDMGILADWSNKTAKVELYAKTNSDFVYKLSEFKVQENNSTSKGSMEVGKKYRTKVKIINS